MPLFLWDHGNVAEELGLIQRPDKFFWRLCNRRLGSHHPVEGSKAFLKKFNLFCDSLSLLHVYLALFLAACLEGAVFFALAAGFAAAAGLWAFTCFAGTVLVGLALAVGAV